VILMSLKLLLSFHELGGLGDDIGIVPSRLVTMTRKKGGLRT